MSPSAILFGSIGAVAETSDLQRRAFNRAFDESGLDWVWEPDAYRAMLRRPGGRGRIADYARARGEDVDADAVHQAKVAAFADLVEQEGILPRPGVTQLIAAARAAGIPVGWATSTTSETVDLMLAGLFPALKRSEFAFVGDATMVKHSKPAPDIFLHAAQEIGVAPSGCLAIEDTPEAAEAAVAAGMQTVAFPNDMAEGRAFPAGVTVVTALTSALLAEDRSAA